MKNTAVPAETLRDGGYQGENRDSPPDCKQKLYVFAPHLNREAIPAASKGMAEKNILGFTLIEILLVFAVALAFILLGFRAYEFYRRDADTQQLTYNVDTLFEALALFYKANCYGNFDPAIGTFTPGKLHPLNNPESPYKINITNLQQEGFLTMTLPLNSLVNNTGGQYSGYIAQFRRYTQPRMVCVTGNGAYSANSPNCTETAKIGTTIIWKAEVGVLLRNTTTTAQYAKILNADCLSSLENGVLKACTPNVNATGDYLMWTRLPSSAAPNATGSEWGANAAVEEFNQMYRTYPINSLLGSNPTGQTPSGQEQYFLCGS